jgi:hypothetical protein
MLWAWNGSIPCFACPSFHHHCVREELNVELDHPHADERLFAAKPSP